MNKRDEVPNTVLMLNRRGLNLSTPISSNKFLSRLAEKQSWVLRFRKGMPSANPYLKEGKSIAPVEEMIPLSIL